MNIVYISLATTKFSFDNIYFSFLEQDATGILIAFNKLTQKSILLGKNFTFCNGLEITNDKKFLLINNLFDQRILKYDLKELNRFVESGGKGELPEFKVFQDKIPGKKLNF